MSKDLNLIQNELFKLVHDLNNQIWLLYLIIEVTDPTKLDPSHINRLREATEKLITVSKRISELISPK